MQGILNASILVSLSGALSVLNKRMGPHATYGLDDFSFIKYETGENPGTTRDVRFEFVSTDMNTTPRRSTCIVIIIRVVKAHGTWQDRFAKVDYCGTSYYRILEDRSDPLNIKRIVEHYTELDEEWQNA